MMRRLLVLCAALLLWWPIAASAAIIVAIPGEGTPLQDAIDSAAPYDTVKIATIGAPRLDPFGRRAPAIAQSRSIAFLVAGSRAKLRSNASSSCSAR